MAEAEEVNNNESSAPKQKAPLVVVLLIVVILLLMAVIGVGAALFFSGALSPKQEEMMMMPQDEVKQAIYIPLGPTFTVTLSGDDGSRFMQVEVNVVSRDDRVPGLIEAHMPAIRSDLVTLFSAQTFMMVNSPEGKESLKAEVLKLVRAILEKEGGLPPKEGEPQKMREEIEMVESVLFTSFVTQ